MKKFKIINSDGEMLEMVFANNERQALCIYLMNHVELTDMMFWKSSFDGRWRLAEYASEDTYLCAQEV